MARDDESLDATLDRYMGQASAPPAGQVDFSVDAVWERLRPDADCATVPARETVTRRSPFTIAAAVLIATVAIGLYAAQRNGLLPAMLPMQSQIPAQVAPASQSPTVSVNPVREMTGSVAESKKPVTTSNPRQPAGVAVPEAKLSQSTDAGASPLQFSAAPMRVPEATGLMTSSEPSRSRGATTPAARLAFEVASIRPIPLPAPREGGPWTASNGRFRAELGYVRGVIAAAYGVKAPQVKGGPDWVDREPYDFEARAASAEAGPNQIRAMLQTLLTERFKLAIHFDTEEATVYTLVVARNGMKLQNANGGQRTYIQWTRLAQGIRATFSENTTLLGLTNSLGSVVGGPVFDETGLRGTYNFSLEFTDPRDPRPRQADSPPDLFTALQEQLGLELRPTKRRVEVIVIDHIERPSEN